MWTPPAEPPEDRVERQHEHGPACTPECEAGAVVSPLRRNRPPLVRCPHCGAAAGMPCVTRTLGGHTLELAGRSSHPSRLEAA